MVYAGGYITVYDANLKEHLPGTIKEIDLEEYRQTDVMDVFVHRSLTPKDLEPLLQSLEDHLEE